MVRLLVLYVIGLSVAHAQQQVLCPVIPPVGSCCQKCDDGSRLCALQNKALSKALSSEITCQQQFGQCLKGCEKNRITPLPKRDKGK